MNKCVICGNDAECANRNDTIGFCMRCIHKYGPGYYGKMSGNELKEFMLKKKNKKWWEIWK